MGAAYVLIILLTAFLIGEAKALTRVTVLCVSLNIVGLLISESSPEVWIDWLNRLLSILCVLLVAQVFQLYVESSDKSLQMERQKNKQLAESEKKYRDLSASLEQTIAARLQEINEQRIKLEKANEKLNQANEDLEQFAYSASHDLQEPIRKILTFIDIIEEENPNAFDEDTQKHFSIVKNAAERMKQLITDLLALSRASKQSLSFEPIDMNRVVANTMDTLKQQLNEKKVIWSVDPLPHVPQGSALLSQVFQNLVTNAIKFIPEDRGPVIRIFGREEPQRYVFGVQDNGIGIREEFQEQIFEVFRRLHAKGQYQGTGIGLSICKKIIQRHDGQIWLNSIENEGTTFYFSLPKAGDAA